MEPDSPRTPNPRFGHSFGHLSFLTGLSDSSDSLGQCSPTSLELLSGEVMPTSGTLQGNALGSVPCKVARKGIVLSALLAISNYRVIVQFIGSDSGRTRYLDAPLTSLESVEQYEDKAGIRLDIRTKDYRWARVWLEPSVNDHYQVKDVLKRAAFGTPLKHRFAFQYSYSGLQTGWDLYIPEWHFAKYGITAESSFSRWKLVRNLDWALCRTYPQVICVVSFADCDYLKRLAKFRTKGRLPVLTYLQRRSGCTLWRSSQPKTKFQAYRNQCDVDYLAYIAITSPLKQLHIYDARPVLNAVANLAKGGGYETERNYTFSKVSFLDIANIHAMREAFAAMKNVMAETRLADVNRQLGWLEHVAGLLRGAVQITMSLEQGASVLVHCSDGWDRTAQLCTLAQLLVDAEMRTLEGFAVLIEKDWLAFGHRFEDRLGLGTAKNSHESPIFLQLLDSVWQILQQFPTHFEFNERLLLDLSKEIYTGKFGTFMCNCDAEREELDIRHRTVSVWTWIFANKGRYWNPFFQPGQTEALFPVTSPRKIVPWKALFWPSGSDCDNAAEVQCRGMELITREVQFCRVQLSAKTAQIADLRAQLAASLDLSPRKLCS